MVTYLSCFLNAKAGPAGDCESLEVFDMIYSEGFVSVIMLVTSKSQNAQGWLC